MTEKNQTTSVTIKPAKGRPMLTWVGKKPLRSVTAYPAQLVESFSISGGKTAEVDWSDWPEGFPQSGLLFHGDNKDVLAYLLANGFRGKVKLIYIDPPFDSGADYIRQVTLRGTTYQLEGEGYTLGEQVQYTDIWGNDNYLQFMFERLLLLKELLAENGSIIVHLDYRRIHYIKSIMDEVFGSDSFVNEIIWCYSGGGIPQTELPRKHDNLLWYSKSGKHTYNPVYRPYSEGTLERGRTAVKGQNSKLRSEGTPVNDWWVDIEKITSPTDPEKLYYPTQKSKALLNRILYIASHPGDIVMDCFIGSGTTADSAQNLGRRWIGVDINKGAIQTTIKRLKNVIQSQADVQKTHPQPLPDMDESEHDILPAQTSFMVYRVNDYDLQVQHNEAFNLAVKHLGMTRTKTDPFFDGTLGRELIKIAPFNHPLTPLDLEQIKDELKSRPEESRDIAVVCLGKELAVDAWLEEWNRLRKRGDFPNKIRVIELHSDPKYGGFFVHDPAQAKVTFERIPEGVQISVREFISPTIITRLKQQANTPLFEPQITDWRAMVDSVMIDCNYDGQVFNITLADVPEKKTDLVDGKYLIQAEPGATIAVKITDMLGEEVLIVQQV